MKKTLIYSTFPLYGKYSLPHNIFDELKISIGENENNEVMFNKHLAGNISKEFQIKRLRNTTTDFLESCAKDFYLEYQPVNKKKKNLINLKLDSLWLNKQKKHEFNPLHNHFGDISFVCWISIPYKLQNEMQLENCKYSNTKSNSLFKFAFTDHLGNIITKKLYIDKSWEGKCIFFDSRLNHQVYPFYTSDEYRISIAGNFVMMNEQSKSQKLFQYN